MPGFEARTSLDQAKESRPSAAPNPTTASDIKEDFSSSTDRAELRREIVSNAPTSRSSCITNETFEANTGSIKQQHKELENIVRYTGDIRNGRIRMRDELTHEVKEHDASWSKLNPWSYRFYEGGLINEKRSEIAAIGNLVTGLTEHENKLRSALNTSQTLLSSSTDMYRESVELRQEADKALERARDFAKQNKEQEARAEAEKARELTIRSLERLQEAQRTQRESIKALPSADEMRSLPPGAAERYSQHLKDSSERLSAIEAGLKQSEDYIRMARNSTIIIGATVATGGLATSAVVGSYGVVGAATISIAGGTGAGTTIGILATTAEQGRSVLEGSKTSSEAVADGLAQTAQDAQTSLTTSVTTYSSLASVGRLAPGLSRFLGESRTAQAVAQFLTGAAGSAPGTVMQEVLDVTANGKESSAPLDFAGKLLKNGVAGGFGNMIGMFGNLARTGGGIRNVTATGGEIAADTVASVGLEAADAKLRGEEFSVADAWKTAEQTVIGNLTGEMASSARARAQRGTPHADSSDIPHAEEPHRPVQNFTNLPSSRPNAPTPQELKRYSFGVEAQTIPLDTVGRDGKISQQRFLGVQKDTREGTIYYLSSADYDKVHKAYHPEARAAQAESGSLNDSFFIKGRQITVVRLPDRGPGTTAIQRDGSLLLSPDEKRYIDALSLHEHKHALGHGEYQAYYDFYRRNDPNQRRTGDTDQPKALSHQETNDLVAKHIFEAHRAGSLSDKETVQILHEMRASTTEDTFYKSLFNASSSDRDSQQIDRLLKLMESSSANVQVTPPNFRQLAKAESRQRHALAEDRLRSAAAHGLHNETIETQNVRVAPLLKRESTLRELAKHSPIELLRTSQFAPDTEARRYAQATVTEKNRQLTLTDGTTIVTDLTVRFHSRTQDRQPELPGYRATIRHNNVQYELTRVPVITAGTTPPSGNDPYVVVTNGSPQMYFQGRPLQGNNAPDMLVTNDGHVFTRQTTIQTSQGKPIQAVANSSGVSIQANASESLKDAWHIPHIPTAMDIAGR
jgi:CHASE3 domain sensor protein